jgi:hypothetical protein
MNSGFQPRKTAFGDVWTLAGPGCIVLPPRPIPFVPLTLMRLFSLLIVAATVAGCASAPAGSTGAPPPQTVTVSGSSSTLRVGGGTSATGTATFPYSVEQVWRVLPFVFDSIGIPIVAMDPAKRTLGNEAFKVRVRLKGTPLSRLIDCGTSTQIGPNADNYDVVMTLTAAVTPAEAGSATVVTTFSAVAKPANFAQDYAPCNSKGVIESRFVDIVRAKLAK